jgi:GNAT superfamily N-acetyltransferase
MNKHMMRTETIQGKTVELRGLKYSDIPALADYLHALSQETRTRFGPHGFDSASVQAVFSDGSPHLGYIALDKTSGRMVAYAIIRKGFLPHDAPRLASYGLQLDEHADATYAPSVADHWQGLGLGTRLFQYILEDLRQRSTKRIILWGGVQQTNEKAVRYYQRLGFRTLGAFEYHGLNLDMVLDIT